MAHSGPARSASDDTENDEEGRLQHDDHLNQPTPASRWLKAVGLLVLATAVLAVAGCGAATRPPCATASRP